MKEYFSKVRRLRLTALVVGGLLYGSSVHAANLVSAVPSDYGNSEMGAVTGSRVTTEIDATPHAGVLKNLNRDPASFGFHQKGKSMILLRQYTYSTTELENTRLIDPNSAGAAASMASGKTTDVPNMHAAAASDEYIYLTGYDMGRIGVVRQSGSKLIENRRAVVNLKNDIKQYCGYNFNETFKNLDEDSKGEKGQTYTGDPAKAQVHGEALLVEGRRLYVAASVNPLGGYDPYDDGFLMQYDIQDDGSLKFGSYTRISRNIDQGRLNKFNDHILVSCIGGYQHYNGTGNTHHTALNIARIDQRTGRLLDTEQRSASIPNHVKETGEDMRDLKLLPDGTAYVMTYNLSPSGSQINAHVYKTTMSNLMSEHPDDWQEVAVANQQEGWFGKLNAEYYTKRLWLELGDTLQAYTDGDDRAKHIWQAKDFSDNKAFSRFNKITMIEPDWVHGNTASVVMTLPAELGGGTTAATVNENAVWKNNAAFSDTITTQQSWNVDTAVSIGKDKLGDKSTNVLAAISATGGKRLNISAKKNSLQMQVENTVGNPTGIYAKGTDLTVSAAKGINILTRGLDGGNTLTNAVQLDALKGKAAQLTINGPLNISMMGGLGGNGVAVQKSDRFKEKSYEASVASGIRINGNLKIAGEQTDQWGIPLNRENVFSRFNNAGILTQVEKSTVTVTGDVDMTVYGNGVTTNAKDSGVRLAGGGSIQVPAGMKYSYYALAAYQGAISMNMGEDGTKPGNGKKINEIADVKLDGDLFALPTGRLDVALLTDKSYLHGLVDNGGTANLYLQNGAKWLNEGRNERYYQDDEDMGAGTMAAVKTRAGGTVGKFYNAQSRVTNFVGGATEAQRGIIYQKSINPLTIENYSGHTAAVYTHDAAAPTSFKGGDIIINKATGAENVFTLFTDGAGVTTGNQNAVLNALANKLTYKSFAESKLSGKLSIGESLTTSSIKGDITFGNEKGSYTGGATPPMPPSTEQTKTEFTSQLTQKEVAEYKTANVEPSPGNYKFTKDTIIRRSSHDGIIAAATYPKQPLNVDASGHKLTLIGDGSNFILGVDNNSKDGIKVTADTLKIGVKSSNGRAFGIRNNQDGSVVTIKGDLDIEAQSSQTAQGLVTSRGAAIETDGLHVELNKDSADGAWAISNSNGTVTVNSDGANEVVINGNVQTGEEGNTNISLTTGQSALNGVIQKLAPSGGEDEEEDEEFSLPVSQQQSGSAKGNVLTLKNGAVWTNEDYNTRKNVLTAAKFTGSQLRSLKGGDDAAHAGVIFQKNDKDITIDNYSGNTRVFYAHDAAAPTTIKGGALKIGKAAADSSITLTTDNSGLNTEATSGADKTLVDNTLNALANKLWYTAYTTGERNLSGKAEIAEGLTTSAASKRIENITFDSTTGQGSYTTTPPSTEQTTTEFTKQLIGTDSDQEYIDANVRQADGTYRFTKDSTITYQNKKSGTRGAIMPSAGVNIDAADHVLTLKSGNGIASVTQGAAIANYGQTLDIKAKTLKLLVDDTTSATPLQIAWGIMSTGGTTNISGMTEIDVAGTEHSKAVQAFDGTVTLEGLRAKANAAIKDAVTLDVQGTGRINVNVKDGTVGSSEVMLDGNITARESGSRVDAALTTGTSYIKGLISGVGTLNLWLQNGAAWHNEEYTTQPTGFASYLTNLAGGSDASHAGAIFQRNDKDITIDNYSGHTRVFYAHDAATPTTIKGGDFRIKNAAAGSAITLTTDSVGLNTESTKAADKNRVSATLNALANKLWYTAYTTGERNLTGKAEIAEGLTTSAASKRVENITFDTASGQGSYAYTPQSEVTTDPIAESETLTYDRQALAANPNTKGGRIVSALFTDNNAYDKQHPMVIDMNGHSLHLEANSKNQIASAIYGGNNKSIQIVNRGEEKALTIKASNTDTRAANGIQTEANSHIYIQGPVTIEDVHTKGYNATAIQTNGTIGSPSDVTIDGDLTVQSIRADRVDTKNKGADDGRNLAALKTTADESKITVKGNVDIQNIKGSVLQTIGADSVIDIGGGTISAAEDADHTKQYYAVHAKKGTVNINTPEGVRGNRKTNITGDMYVTREYGKKTVEYSGGQLVDFDSKGMLNVSLTTADSSWTGAATYNVDRADFGSGGFTAHDVGRFNLTLQNGARWTNEQKSSATDKWMGSRLSALWGGSNANNAGVIFQKNAKDITIDNYSGHTRVFYEHDAAAPTTIKGGDFRIKNAAAGSAITLTTDNSGLNTEAISGADKTLVDNTLNALANKLWYTAYTTGERNLSGKAEIAEGLTTSAASKRIENITFDGTTGQGSYTTTPPPPPIGEQTKTEFTSQLTQKEVAEYKDANVEPSPGNYKFTKDTTISKTSYTGAISNTGFPKNPLTIDADGHVLTVKGEGNNGLVTGIKNNGEKGIAIAADTVKINVKSSTGKAYGVWNAKSGSTIKIAGNLEISATGGDAAKGLSAGNDAAIETDGLDVTLNKASLDGWSIDNNGIIKINKEGTHKVILRGNIHSGANGSTDLSLTTADSSLSGVVHKKGETANGVSLFLTNGAVWNNQDWNQSSAVLEKVSFAGSRLASLKGGSNANNAGVIFQKNAKDITIDNYSGYTRVFYEHDAAAPTTIKGGDFRIKNAAAGSAITLTTDSAGLNTESTAASDKNLVSATLNALANKLWYTAYTTGERNLTGKAEIAEGLTTSAASKRIEDITFDGTSGQGSYVYTPEAEGQTKTEFTKRLFGTTSDQEYIDAHVRQEDGTYQFTKDSTITYQNASDMNRGAIKPNVDVDIDATDRVLTVKSGGRAANVKESAAIANDGKALDIKAKTLKLLVNDTTSVAPLQSAWGIRTTGNSVTNISGMTEIDVGGTKVSKAVQAFGGTVTLQGLSAKTNTASEDAAALFAQNGGRISVNVKGENAGDSAVALDGNIAAKDAASRVDVGLRGEASHFKGLAYGDGTINMWLQKDAVWQNGKQGALLPTGFTGSHISRFVGGPSSDRAGAIFQNDDKNITIDTYHGYTKVFFAHDSVTPTNIKGGDIVIGKALGGSSITLITDNAGLNMEASAATAEKNLVSATLNSLANKLWYTAYTTGERSLAGKVQIAEGLTTSAASKRIGDITFDETTGRGGYIYTPLIDPPASQTDTDFTTAITGDETHDIPYTNAGVRKADGQYIFTKDSTITTGKDLIAAGAWMSNISAAVSNASTGKTLDINLNGKNLAIKTVTDVSTTGISAIGKDSKVNIKNAGAISIDAESTNYGQTATLFVNGGGAIHIENGGSDLENKVLKVRANGNYKTNVAVIKSMNGVTGVESNITIDGLVDVLADGNDAANGKGANEAVSAVASKIDIGGGSIRAINGAWAAIRAYGEFVSDNYGTVNFNVTKGADGLANGAGTNRAVIEGDIVTNGGMGTKGRVSVGLSTADSHWIGNYADTRGYGVTPGQLGAVNLFMKNGSYWKGFSNGSMKVEMSGEGTNWTGFNVGDNMQLKLSDGAIWHNAITQEQKDQDNRPVSSKVKHFTGSGGFIDMTGTNRFLASSNSLSGAPVQTGSSSIEEKGLGETGDLTIDEFNGSTTMLYRHDALSPTTIYGGKLTIGKAAAGSLVKMVTDSVGLNTESAKAADKNLVSATLNALANKLWYTAYTTGERNLTGKAEIAEGLTTSSASKRVENITFNETSGQGGYVYTPSSEGQTKTEFATRILGKDSDQEYIDANVRQADGTYRFTKDSRIRYTNDDEEDIGVIHPSEDVKIDASDHELVVATNTEPGGKTAVLKNSGKKLDIKAGKLRLEANDPDESGPEYSWGILHESGTTTISGMTEIGAIGYTSSRAVEAKDGTVMLEGLKARTTAYEEALALLAGSTGRISVNVKNNTAGSHTVKLDGDVGAMGEASHIDVAMVNQNSGLNGLAFGKGKINFWLQNGAVWNNEKHGISVPDKNSDGIGKDYDYTFSGSRLASLKGGSDASHAGVIFQKNDKNISIDNYSGHTRVFYSHDAATPTTMIGGDFRIKNAAVGSAVTLTTDNTGLNTESTKAADKNLVSATLNALANKLWYTAYTTGERNLSGKAEIVEGLTTSAASKRIEDITFDGTSGRGNYVYTPAVDPPPSTEQTKTEFTTRLRGTDSDQEYIDANVRQADSTYHFTKDSNITYQNSVSGFRSAIMPDTDVHINAADRVLTIKSGSGITSVTQGAAIANYGKALDIKAKTLKLLVNGTTSVTPLQTAWGILSMGGTTNISGMTEIDVAGTERSKAVQAYGGTVNLDGLRAKANAAAANAATLDVQEDGRINVNVKDGTVGSNDVMLDGNIVARETGSRVDAALTTGTSYLKGLISGVGTLNLWLQNGAAWHNEEYTTQPTGFSSRLSNFTGGSDASRAGVIFQKNNNAISIDNYSGHARVFYKHDAATPTTMIGGDFRIKNAAAGSSITLTTDSTGLNTESMKAADKNLVSATLNALANKLWYTAYTTGERNLTGKAEIAEGLTTSSASKRVENIAFNESTGQGGYAYTPAVDPPKPPQPGQDEQTTTEFTTPITGDAASNADYVAGHVLKNDTYTFTKNSKITAATGIQAVQNKLIKVQAAGAELKIQATDYGVDAGANSKVAITGKQLTIDAGSRSIRAAAGSDVSVAAGFDLKGAIENNGGRISLNDTGRKSSLVGDITQTAGNFNLRMQGLDSKLNSKIIASGGILDLSMEGAGATFTGSIRGAGSAKEAGMGERRLTLEDRTVWNVTAPSNLTRLNAKQGSIINYLFSSDEGVNVENFKGAATVHYDGRATSNGTLTLANTGKFRIRNVDGTGNALTIATDAQSGNDAADEKIAKTLARQFEYVGNPNNIQNNRIQGLSVSALIADGVTSSSKRYNILMGTDGIASDVKPFVSNIEYGDYETKLMSGVKSAMTASAMAWRAESNDLMKRLGDLRLSPEKIGTWVRFYRGKASSNKNRAEFSMNYSTIQVGHDWDVGNNWRVGIAGSYMKGSSNYANGRGDNKEGNFGIYGTWKGDNGEYLDLIAKIGRLSNEYTVYNDFGHYVKGDYCTWGGSVSAEYGRRISRGNGSFIEPQIELIYSHLNGADYMGTTDYLTPYGTYQQMHIRQDAMNSLIGRIGLGFGREMENSTWFAKASLYHEFSGKMQTYYSDGVNPWKSTSQDNKDTWVALQLGGTVKLSNGCTLYGDFEKTFGGEVKTDWRVDAGLRWSF